MSPVLSALARFRWPIIAGNITEIGVCSGLLAIVKHQSNMDENRILGDFFNESFPNVTRYLLCIFLLRENTDESSGQIHPFPSESDLL